MQIRPAREDEAAELSALAFSAKAHWSYTPEQLEAWRSDLTVTAHMIAANPTQVVEIDKRIAGFFMLEQRNGKCALEYLWVLPESMGRGVGRALLAHAAMLAAQAGAAFLTIDADPYAEAFYLACGAQRTGQIAAPIAGSPERVRPQMVLSTT